MKESWISKRRTLCLSGLTIDCHVSEPNALDFPGCNDHLLCLLLSDSNQQKLTRIGEQSSEKAQSKGDFWICPAKTSGLWDWASTDESLMFVINPVLLNQTAKDVSGCDTSTVELLSTIGAHDPQLEAIARLFQAELDTGGVGSSLYAESLMQVLLIHLLRHHCALQPKIQPTTASLPAHRLQTVQDYIHSRLDQPLQLAELAAVSGLSQYHFCRVFKQTIGLAPYQYVLKQRMEKAKVLLHQGNHTLVEISLLVGCTDQSRFAKHFRKHFGVTPRELLGKTLP
ncbi:MAG: AraC family transcriptional regulator [Tildeniella nuda ZEHNDER 1965/U140]|jgi:AraC family transcriptional regulator|nr:AraC family transcriptional regulator [Tildeniella nuda ZEHNDER 1965/U140]